MKYFLVVVLLWWTALFFIAGHVSGKASADRWYAAHGIVTSYDFNAPETPEVLRKALLDDDESNVSTLRELVKCEKSLHETLPSTYKNLMSGWAEDWCYDGQKAWRARKSKDGWGCYAADEPK